MPTNQIALQLYTVREHTAQDMLGTLRELATMGYEAVELAGYGGVAVDTLAATLRERQIAAVSAHVSLQQWLNQQDQVFKELHTLGCQHAILPWVSDEQRSTVDQVHQLAEQLNQIGRRCQEEGIRFGYHNHAFEFAPLGNTTMWELLIDHTDPALVALELDVFWAHYAGVDPVALIQRLGQRIPLLHIKDMAADGSRNDTPVGTGMLPWQDILPAAMAAEVQWFIVEQDNPRDPLRDVQTSLANLQGLLAQALS